MFRHVSFLALSVLAVPSILSAATFNPATSADLQTALNTAAASTEDDTINLQANTTYFTDDNGNAPFVYNSTNDGSLTLTGAGMGSSILDGNSARQVLSIITSGTLAKIQISALTVQNGASSFTGLQIQANGGDVSLTDCELKDNQSSFAGGAQLQVDGGSNITVQGNVITGNSGAFTNGIQVQNNSNGGILFEGNTLTDNNGNSSAFAGGVQLQNNGTGNMIVRGNTITGSIGAFATGIQVQNNDQGTVTFETNVLSGNLNPSSFAGAAEIQQNGTAALQIADNLVFGNSSATNGGGLVIVSDSQTANLVNNTVFGNSVNDSAGIGGGGIFVSTGPDTQNFNIFNNILFSNTTAAADSGSDLLVSFGPASAVQLFNNDFAQTCFGASPPYNCDPTTVAGVSQGNNIDKDPLFVDSAGGNFQLSAGSPAIDTGDLNAPGLPTLDLAGNPRVANGQVDMGAYEAQPAFSVSPTMLDFGSLTVGKESSQVLTLSNTGAAGFTVSGFSLSDSAHYSIDPQGGPTPCGPAPFTVEPGKSCTVGVVFSASSPGSFASTLTVESDGLPGVIVTLSGIGIGGGKIQGGGCSLGAVSMEGNLFLTLWIPLSALALCFRRKR